MEYLWNTGGLNLGIKTLDVDSYLSEISGLHFRELYAGANCAFSFDACVIAGFFAAHIIVNTPELYELSDEFKTAIQQAAILLVMCEPNTDGAYNRTLLLKNLVDASFNVTQSAILGSVLFQNEQMNVLHDSRLTLLSAANDAQQISIMLTPYPRQHVFNEDSWAVTKYAVEMAPIALRTKPAIALHENLIAAWRNVLAKGTHTFVHPITSCILQQQEIIANAQNTIKEIIEECKHPAVNMIVEHKGDTGNWSQSDDSYARKETCTLCGRHEYWNKNHGERDYTLLSTTNHRLPIKT